MFEVGKFYESNNGDKLLCEKFDERDNTWMFCGDGDYSYIVIWVDRNGRISDFEYLGPIIKGPWIEK